MNKLSEADIELQLAEAEGWSLSDEKWIVKKYRFSQYLKGIEFVGKIAHIAEAMNHHPMIKIEYRLVTVSLSTWSAAGLTELDFKCAKEFDKAFSSMSG